MENSEQTFGQPSPSSVCCLVRSTTFPSFTLLYLSRPLSLWYSPYCVSLSCFFLNLFTFLTPFSYFLPSVSPFCILYLVHRKYVYNILIYNFIYFMCTTRCEDEDEKLFSFKCHYREGEKKQKY